MHFVVDHSQQPPMCLPDHVYALELWDVTRINDSWRRYVTLSGELHDGAVYAEQMRESLADIP